MVKYGSVYSGTVLMFSGNLLMVLIIAVAWYRVSRN